MRYVLLAGVLCVAAIFAGCGNDSTEKDAGATEKETTSTAVTVNESSGVKSTPRAAAKRGEPVVEVPPEPAPKDLVVNDLLVGTGATAETGDVLTVHEVAVEYEAERELESIYGNEAFRFELGSDETIEGWKRGLVGMRAGGRRELIVPPDLAYEKDTLIYVVDLLEVKKAPPSRGK